MILIASVIAGLAQNTEDRWLRVLTGEESIIDVDRSSLVLGANQITARFRTQLLKPEPAPGKSDVKYQTRIDIIRFDTNRSHYRIVESSFLDQSGKTVSSNSPDEANSWKPLWGRTGRLLFRSAKQLRPFGFWKVLSYRYASGEKGSDDDPRELTSLAGSYVQIEVDEVKIGSKRCREPQFDARTITNDEVVERIGTSLNSLGIQSPKLDAILLVCRNKNEFPQQTVMFRQSGDRNALLLWDGVFLELERTKNIFSP